MRTISDTILVLRARQFVLAYLLARHHKWLTAGNEKKALIRQGFFSPFFP